METLFVFCIFFWAINLLTAQTPAMVKDLNPGFSFGITGLAQSAVVDNVLYFTGNNDANGAELWKSDGSEAGTVLVKDIYTGIQSSQQKFYAVYNGQLYFAAFNPVIGEEMWRSDDTEGAILLAGDACPGTCDGAFNGSKERIMGEYQGKLYFKLKSPGLGSELWSSDGTEAGTALFKETRPGSSDGNPYGFTVFKDKLYFTASAEQVGSELWVSDGTVAGTELLKDINSSLFGDSDMDTPVVGADAFFAALGVFFDTKRNRQRGWQKQKILPQPNPRPLLTNRKHPPHFLPNGKSPHFCRPHLCLIIYKT